jgi:hypothetical protein
VQSRSGELPSPSRTGTDPGEIASHPAPASARNAAQNLCLVRLQLPASIDVVEAHSLKTDNIPNIALPLDVVQPLLMEEQFSLVSCRWLRNPTRS